MQIKTFICICPLCPIGVRLNQPAVTSRTLAFQHATAPHPLSRDGLKKAHTSPIQSPMSTGRHSGVRFSSVPSLAWIYFCQGYNLSMNIVLNRAFRVARFVKSSLGVEKCNECCDLSSHASMFCLSQSCNQSKTLWGSVNDDGSRWKYAK